MIGYGGHCIDTCAPPSFTTPRLAMTWTRHPLTFMLSTPTYLTAEYDPRVDCSSPTSCHHYVIIGRHAPLPFYGSRLCRAHESRLVFDARPGGHITDRIVAVLQVLHTRILCRCLLCLLHILQHLRLLHHLRLCLSLAFNPAALRFCSPLTGTSKFISSRRPR